MFILNCRTDSPSSGGKFSRKFFQSFLLALPVVDSFISGAASKGSNHGREAHKKISACHEGSSDV